MFNNQGSLPSGLQQLNKKDLLSAVHDLAVQKVDDIIRGFFTPRPRHEELEPIRPRQVSQSMVSLPKLDTKEVNS